MLERPAAGGLPLGALLLATALSGGCTSRASQAQGGAAPPAPPAPAADRARAAAAPREAAPGRAAGAPRRRQERPRSATRRARETVIRLVAAGDVMFGRYQPRGHYTAFGMDRPFRRVAARIRGADIALVNLETPIAALAYAKPYRGLTFRAPPAAARLLADAGFTVAATANNHAFDQGARGILETLVHLGRAGLGYAGTGRTAEDAWAPYVYQKRGVRVAVLAATLLRNFPPRTQAAHFAYVPLRRAHSELPRRIAALRPHFDFIVLSLHFGVEYYQTIGRFDRTLVEKLVAAGLDVLVGHHPHVMRPVIHTGDAVLFYSLGNFLFDYQMKGSQWSALGALELVKRGSERSIRNVRLIPIYRHWKRIPALATGRRAARIRRMIRRITDRYKTGTRFRRVGEDLAVQPPLNAPRSFRR